MSDHLLVNPKQSTGRPAGSNLRAVLVSAELLRIAGPIDLRGPPCCIDFKAESPSYSQRGRRRDFRS
jgi:hypothetical protein